MALPALLGTLGRAAGAAAGASAASANSSRPSVKPAVAKMGVAAPRNTSSSNSVSLGKTSITPSDVVSNSPVKLLRSMVKMITKMSAGIEQQNKITLAQAKQAKEDRLEGSPATKMQEAIGSGLSDHTKKLGVFTLAVGGLVFGVGKAIDGVTKEFETLTSAVGDKLGEFGDKLRDLLPDWMTPGGGQEKQQTQPQRHRPRWSSGARPGSSSTGRSSVPSGANMSNVKRIIQQAESGGNPDAIHGPKGRPSTGREQFGKSMTTMTIREVYNQSRALARKDGAGGSSGAAGLYQIIPRTMRELMEKHGEHHGLDWNDKFTAANQDKLADALIHGKRKITHGMSENEVIDRLAMEWAGLPVSRNRRGHRGRRVQEGQSYYAGVQGNKSNVSVESIRGALRQDRTNSLSTRISQTTTSPEPKAMQPARRQLASNLMTAPSNRVPPSIPMDSTAPSQNTTIIQAPSNSPQEQTQIVSPNRDRSSDYGWYFDTRRA